MTPESPVRSGDTYVTPDGDRIHINRVASSASGMWADTTVTQPHGASWTKRQPLRDGRLPFAAEKVGGAR